jgi:hypothetical protein
MVKKFVAAAFATGALLAVSAGVASAAPSGNPTLKPRDRGRELRQ